MEQLPKSEVEFEHPAKGDHHCSQCVHFEVLHKNGCEVVQGHIEAQDWCDKFKPKPRKFVHISRSTK